MKFEGHTLIWGPYQPLMSEYPLTGEKHPRRFQSHWFKSYQWLEYSEKNTAFLFSLLSIFK